VTSELIQELARQCGFELAGAAPALPLEEAGYYRQWIEAGYAGEMDYLTDHRADVRVDPRRLLASARSVICVGKLYNGPQPYSTHLDGNELAWISRYAWGEDYHDVLRHGLGRLVEKLGEHAGPFDWKICIGTAPLLERAYARRSGLGWIGKNTCLINQEMGSWFFLGELLVSLEISPPSPPPDRCGTCTRCIDACPTMAIIPTGLREGPEWTIDSRLCIAYFTIELRGRSPESCILLRHLSGCMSVEHGRPVDGRARLRAAALCTRSGEIGASVRGGIPRNIPIESREARPVRRLSTQRRRGHGQPALGAVSRTARKTGAVGGAECVRTRALGAGAARIDIG